VADQAADEHVVGDARLHEQRHVLERLGEAERRDLVRPHAGDLYVLQADGSGVGFLQSDDGIEQRRLARPVGPDEAEDLALRHVEADVAERLQAAEPLGQVFQRQNRLRHPVFC
jgi:hypothetical protein